MSVITFEIVAQQPLLLTSLQGDPNSSVSFSYIPGSVIRGAFIGRYIEQEKRRSSSFAFDPGDESIQRLFFDGTICYLNAYPRISADGEKQRGLPIPNAWFKEKHTELADELKGVDYSQSSHPDLDKRKPFDGQYCWFEDSDDPRIVGVERHINIHNQRDRAKGRGEKGSGAVFQYDAIAPGQTFIAAIVLPSEDIATIKPLLEPHTLWIGGSRSAGYGCVSLENIQEHASWNETGTTVAQRIRSQNHNNRLHITLLSDMVVRDDNGQYTTQFPVNELEKHLGLSQLKLDTKHSFQRTTKHGGFNRAWGLPLPQTPALAAGSVLVFTLENTADVNEMGTNIASVEAHGLGERRAEGFGRIAINWYPSNSSFTARKPDTLSETDAGTIALSPESTTLIQNMARRMMQQRMEIHLTEQVSRCKLDQNNRPSNTQLSRLRIVARRAMTDPVEQGLERIEKLIKTFPSNARDQFENARVGNQRFSTWLAERIKDYRTDWKSVSPSKVTLAGVEMGIDDELAREYTLRLIIAVARQAIKDAK